MRWRHFGRDTIGRWIAINIVVAVVVAAAMNAAFVQFAGVWAKPGLFDIGIVDQAAAVVRVIQGAPPSLRSRLAEAGSNPGFIVQWHADDKALPIPIEGGTFHAGRKKVRELLGRPDARVLAYEAGEPGIGGRPIPFYVLAIDLPDRSWVQFIAPQRSWGLSAGARFALIAAFVIICSLVVAALASRRLARPMERFARQAQRFGRDVDAPQMDLSGPLEFRVAAQAFNEMQERVQRYVTARTEMLAAISHDLRAPLTRMRLRGEFITDAEQQRKLFRDVDEMQAMVDASLRFFRDDSDREPTTRFKLSELVSTVVDDLRDEGHDVVFEERPGITYTGRPLALRRALSNVVENALKYGGRATVTLRTTPASVEVEVEDEGPGIAPELREAVFRPFYRIESSRNRATGGVGLGLAAARSALRAHGGDVVLDSAPGGGLRARLILPSS